MVLGSVGRLGKVPTFVRKMTVDGIKIAKIAKTLPLTSVFFADNRNLTVTVVRHSRMRERSAQHCAKMIGCVQKACGAVSTSGNCAKGRTRNQYENAIDILKCTTYTTFVIRFWKPTKPGIAGGPEGPPLILLWRRHDKAILELRATN